MLNKKNYYDEMIHTLFEGFLVLQIIKKEDNLGFNASVINVNEAFEFIFGIPKLKLLNKQLVEVLPELDKRLPEIIENFIKTNQAKQYEFYLENDYKHFLVRVFDISDDKLSLLFIETTIKKKARDSFRLHEVLFDNAYDIMLYIKLNGKIVNANKRACEQYGYTKEQLSSMMIQDIRHPSTANDYDYQMQLADEEGVTFECIHLRSNGEAFPVEVSAKSIDTENGRFRVHIIRDITMRKKGQERIAWLAKYDLLTEIPNRASFMMRLEEEIQRSMRDKIAFAVMLFDIDKFKHINDQYGHKMGDFVLHHVAQKAQKVLRAGDVIARLGGDEFVVLQTGIKCCDDVENLANRILSSTGETISHEGLILNLKLSVGICLFPNDALDSSGLLHHADQAMYDIKQRGGGSFCFYSPCDSPCILNKICFDKHKNRNTENSIID